MAIPMLVAMMFAVQGAEFFASSSLAKGARNLQRAQLDTQMNANRLASTEQAVANTHRLREILATNTAISAASGKSSSQGSMRVLQAESEGDYSRDELARKLSLDFSEGELGINKSLLDLEYQGKKAAGLFKLAKNITGASSFNGGSSAASSEAAGGFLGGSKQNGLLQRQESF